MELRYYRNRLLLLCGAVVCFVIFWQIGAAAGIPAHRGFGGSLLTQPWPIVPVLMAAAALVICTAVGTGFAGRIRFDAGLFCAAMGLSAWSMRSGAARYVLFEVAGPGAYLVMAFELLILGLLIALAWSVLWLLHRRGLLAGDEFLEGVEDVVVPLNQRLLALLTQVVVMGVLVLLLVQSDRKPQVIIGVFAASWLAAWASHALSPVRPSIWFWTGPFVVGIIGYLAAFASPGAWYLGQIPQALARPLPLDYASVGVAGALTGYWMSRKSLTGVEAEAAA